MTVSCRQRISMLLVLGAACAGASAAPSPAAPTALASAADSARCVRVADSLLALSPDELPVSRPVGHPRLPRPRADAGTTVLVRTRFIVRPEGTADTATVVVEGASDPNYRQAMVRLLARQRFEVPMVQGCPVSGRGDFTVLGIPARSVQP
jgi:hypothetical protein